MRNTYIVSYDISGPKRLRKVFKTMKAWENHLQLFVFECQTTPFPGGTRLPAWQVHLRRRSTA